MLKAEQGLPGTCSLQSAPLGTFWHIYTGPPAVSPAQHVSIRPFRFSSLSGCFGVISSCLKSHLVFNFVGIRRGSVGIFVGVQRSDKLIVVNVAVCVSVKDICHCCHFQFAGGKLCRKITGVSEVKSIW